jgi:putative oxidoreductase
VDLTSTYQLWMIAVGLLVARVVFGLLMAAHGAQKLFGWFGGSGLNATGEQFAQFGFPPGRLFASIAAIAEFVGGLLFSLGLFGPVGPALMIAVMLVAVIGVHWRNGLLVTHNGVELPLLYGTGAFGIALIGYGPYSLDAVLGIDAGWSPTITWIVLAIGIFGGIVNLLLQRRPAAQA